MYIYAVSYTHLEIIILKESNSAEEHLAKLEELLPRATGKVKENIQKEIILTKAGIDGEKKVLYELKNSNMDLVKKCWREIRAKEKITLPDGSIRCICLLYTS